MFLFAHVGITAAVVRAGDNYFKEEAVTSGKPGLRGKISRIFSAIRSQSGKIDYRMVIIGSMLPDIIDKSLFLILGKSGETLSGRDYSHSLLFCLALFAGGLFLLRYRKPWLLVLSLGSVTHLLLDRMWGDTVALFWPFMGPLKGEYVADWATGMWNDLFTVPEVYIPEIIGIIIVIYFAIRIIRNRGIPGFIRTGSIA